MCFASRNGKGEEKRWKIDQSITAMAIIMRIYAAHCGESEGLRERETQCAHKHNEEF